MQLLGLWRCLAWRKGSLLAALGSAGVPEATSASRSSAGSMGQSVPTARQEWPGSCGCMDPAGTPPAALTMHVGGALQWEVVGRFWRGSSIFETSAGMVRGVPYAFPARRPNHGRSLGKWYAVLADVCLAAVLTMSRVEGLENTLFRSLSGGPHMWPTAYLLLGTFKLSAMAWKLFVVPAQEAGNSPLGGGGEWGGRGGGHGSCCLHNGARGNVETKQ